jgi:hypothetical protein
VQLRGVGASDLSDLVTMRESMFVVQVRQQLVGCERVGREEGAGCCVAGVQLMKQHGAGAGVVAAGSSNSMKSISSHSSNRQHQA